MWVNRNIQENEVIAWVRSGNNIYLYIDKDYVKIKRNGFSEKTLKLTKKYIINIAMLPYRPKATYRGYCYLYDKIEDCEVVIYNKYIIITLNQSYKTIILKFKDKIFPDL